jgi:hypothetical protein
LYERLLDNITRDDVDAGFHQQPNRRCAVPSQLLPREFEATRRTVPLNDEEVLVPILPFGFPLKPVFSRPCDGLDAILGDPRPTTCQQRSQPAAAQIIGGFVECTS